MTISPINFSSFEKPIIPAQKKSLFNADNAATISKTASLIDKLVHSFHHVFGCAANIAKSVKLFKCCALLTIPSTIKKIIDKVFSFRKTEDKVEVGFSLGSECVNLAGGIYSFADWLSLVGAFAKDSIKWMTPISTIVSIIQIPDTIFTLRNYSDTSRSINFLESHEYTKEIPDIEKKRLVKHLKISEDKITAVFQKVIGNKKNTDQVINTLKGRVTEQKQAYRSSLIMKTINLVMTGLMFTPAAPVVLALTGPIALVSFIFYLTDKSKEQELHFAKQFDELALSVA